MPKENATRRSARLNLETLEAREVPATFGTDSGVSVAFGDIIPVQLDNGQAEYITGTGPSPRRDSEVRVWDTVRHPPPPVHTFPRVQARRIRRDGGRERQRPAGLARFDRRGDAGPGPGLRIHQWRTATSRRIDPIRPNLHGTGADRRGRRDWRLRGGDHRRPGHWRRNGQGLRVRLDGVAGLRDPFVPTIWGGLDPRRDGCIGQHPQRLQLGRDHHRAGSFFPQVKIFNAELPTVEHMASYMAFDISNPLNLRGIDVTAGSTDGTIVNNVLFRQGAEIYVSLRGAPRFGLSAATREGSSPRSGPTGCSQPHSPGALTLPSVFRSSTLMRLKLLGI